jgi:hypothetical protein
LSLAISAKTDHRKTYRAINQLSVTQLLEQPLFWHRAKQIIDEVLESINQWHQCAKEAMVSRTSKKIIADVIMR